MTEKQAKIHQLSKWAEKISDFYAFDIPAIDNELDKAVLHLQNAITMLESEVL